MTPAIHPILKRLSHSSVLLLHSCPRKYQLTKLLARDTEESDDLSYGDCVGYGIQQLLLERSIEEVWIEIFLRWSGDVIDYSESTERKKKTLWHVFHCLTIFEGRYKRNLLAEYEVATLRGMPACELGFRINIGNDYQYRGFVDVVLIHRRTRELAVLEIKTTGKRSVGAAAYQNSGQGLGYSIICDYISQEHPEVNGSSYKILYFVYSTTAQDFIQFPFGKSHSQRAMWIKQLLQEVERIEGYGKDGLWPMFGESCESWGRPCQFLDTCHMSDSFLLRDVNPKIKEESFTFDIGLMDLINAQLERHQEGILL